MDTVTRCPSCGRAIFHSGSPCPACGASFTPSPTAGRPSPAQEFEALLHEAASRGVSEREGSRGPTPQLSPHLQELFERLDRWREGALRLGVQIPVLPPWARRAAASDGDEDRWEDILQKVERQARTDLTRALEAWQRETAARLTRLEAYEIPSPNERKLLVQVSRWVRSGDLTQALELYPRVDHIVSLKERALDEAREGLEALGVLLADMRTLGLSIDAADLGRLERMEIDLRHGKVGETKASVADIRERILRTLPAELRRMAENLGELVAQEKLQRREVGPKVQLLVRALLALREQRFEEALRHLVNLKNQGILDPFSFAEKQAAGA